MDEEKILNNAYERELDNEDETSRYINNQAEGKKDSQPSPKRKKSASNKEGKRTSPVLNRYNFFKTEEGLFVQCKYCKIQTYKYESRVGTSNAKRHYLGCKSYKNYLKENSNDVGAKRVYDHIVFCKLFAEAILGHGYALSMVEHERHRKLVSYLNPDVRTVSRNTVTKIYVSEYGSLKKQSSDTLGALTSRVCLTCDLWQACTVNAYFTLTAHFVDNTWKLQSKALNFCHFPPPHNGYDIYELVKSLLREWGIEKNIFTITVDNASSMNAMVDKLRNDLGALSSLPMDGKYFHIRCSAHILNLIVKEGLSVIDESVIKLRELVKYISYPEGRKIKFQQCAVASNSLFKSKLRTDTPTKWNLPI